MNLEIISCEPKSSPKPTPILFVHGMWHGAWVWAENFMPYFARRGYASRAVSLRGHGQSEGPASMRRVRLRDYVADVVQAAQQFQTPPIIIGHSMGGVIVQKYLEEHPSPAAVLLASGPPSGLIPSALSLAKRHPLVFLKSTLTLRLRPLVATPALYRELFFSATVPDSRLMEYFGRLNDESYGAMLDLMGLDLPHPERVAAPVLVIGAAHDQSILPEEFESTASRYQTKPVMFEMNHNMMLEDGWPMVADCILQWLQERNL